MFKGCPQGVLKSFEGVSKVFQDFFKGASRMFHACFKGVYKLFKDVLRIFQGNVESD